MRELEVVVLSKFPEYFAGFRESIERDRGKRGGIVIWDGEDHSVSLRHLVLEGWTCIDVNTEFQIAKNANLGFSLTNPEADVLYVGDDVRFTELGTIEALQGAAYSDPEIGILSPKIIGHAQELQQRPTSSPLTYVPFVAFVCVYIKRAVIEKVGLLDERFEGYGMEDLDLCYRARAAGFKIAVAAEVSVKHGINGHLYGSTFIPVRGEEQMAKDDAENRRRFAEKYGIENDSRKIMEFIEKGI